MIPSTMTSRWEKGHAPALVLECAIFIHSSRNSTAARSFEMHIDGRSSEVLSVAIVDHLASDVEQYTLRNAECFSKV
jgi:hypothetical protein